VTETIFTIPYSAALFQFLRERPEEKGLLQEEVVAGKHPQREGATSLSTPGFKIAIVHSAVLQAAKHGGRAIRGGSVEYTYVSYIANSARRSGSRISINSSWSRSSLGVPFNRRSSAKNSFFGKPWIGGPR
jgi:hypothetical protein